MTGPSFVAPERHRRELSACRALVMLRAQFGYGAFPPTDGRMARPLALDTGTVHGPFRVPGDTNDRPCYGSHYPRLAAHDPRPSDPVDPFAARIPEQVIPTPEQFAAWTDEQRHAFNRAYAARILAATDHIGRGTREA